MSGLQFYISVIDFTCCFSTKEKRCQVTREMKARERFHETCRLCIWEKLRPSEIDSLGLSFSALEQLGQLLGYRDGLVDSDCSECSICSNSSTNLAGTNLDTLNLACTDRADRLC